MLNPLRTEVFYTANVSFLLCRVTSYLLKFCMYMWGFSERKFLKESNFQVIFLVEHVFLCHFCTCNIRQKNAFEFSLAMKAC